MTAGFACAKVNREHEWVHSPERVLTPLRRVGAKGEGRFEPISWARGARRDRRPLAGHHPRGRAARASSATPTARTRASSTAASCSASSTRSASRGSRPGTVCDSCAEAGWDAACGSVGGADPETVVESDLVIAWGADLLTTNVHIWPLVERARARGAKLVVIEPRRSRTAERADWHLRVNVGTRRGAGARRHARARARRPLRSRLLARETVGFERLEREVLPRFDPAARGRDHRRVRRPTSSVSRTCTAARGRPSSGSARACRAACRAARPSARWRSCRASWAPTIASGGGALLMTATGFGLDTAPSASPRARPRRGS